jgi:endonuclease YncB( thermonuclease family)
MTPVIPALFPCETGDLAWALVNTREYNHQARLSMKIGVRSLFVVVVAAAGLFAVTPQPANPPKPFVAKVVRVSDGDTITVQYEGDPFVVRLETIDAPEMTQAHGPKAKEVLADKILGKEVKVVWKSKDKYRRIRGEVYLEDRRLCLEMVAEGHAWHYTQFSKDPLLAKAEREARQAKRGLWADDSPVPPWEFRIKAGTEREEVTEPDKVAVYVTKSGEKYHRKGCQHLSKSQRELTLAEALKLNYGPCTKCNPPVVARDAKE